MGNRMEQGGVGGGSREQGAESREHYLYYEIILGQCLPV